MMDRRARVWFLWLTAAASCWSGETAREGGGGSEPPAPAPACPFGGDGVCDEPANCPLGTDPDCDGACGSGVEDTFHAGACAFRSGVTVAPDSRPSRRAEHVDGMIRMPSGLNPRNLVPRYYRLYVPSAYDPDRPAPLVLVLPGHRVAIYSLADYTEIMTSSEVNGFIVAYVDQEWRWSDLRWAFWTDWSWARTVENPDLVFIRALIDEVAGRYNVDRTRLFVTGHSRGGAMALIAAIELPELFRGAVIQSGFTEFGYDQRLRSAAPPRRTPMVFVHGARDEDICIDCRPGGVSSVCGRACGGTAAGDEIVRILREKGWTESELSYHRLENVTHRWQPYLNQSWWDFFSGSEEGS